MSLKSPHIAIALLAALGLAGCGTDGKPLLGAAKPAEKPGQSVIAAAKVRGGGIIAGRLAGQLDEKALTAALDAEFQALEFSDPGASTPWSGGNARGEVNAAQPYQVGTQNCRAYTHTVFIGDAPQTARGTACRNTDGSWTPLT